MRLKNAHFGFYVLVNVVPQPVLFAGTVRQWPPSFNQTVGIGSSFFG